MRLVSELRRRNVFRMAALYIVSAWLIVQVADAFKDLLNLPEWLGPTVLGLLAIGFPIALLLSWFYELTPEGVELDKDFEAGHAGRHAAGRRSDFIVIALLSAGLILFAVDKWWPPGPDDNIDDIGSIAVADNSIAVVPINESGDLAQDYYVDGIAEGLLKTLERAPGVRVIARESSFQFRDGAQDIVDIGQQLNVAFVLEGSVYRVGPEVRITTRLVDARDDTSVWSETYASEVDESIEIQNEISVALASALTEHLNLEDPAPAELIGTTNAEAHEAYLRGRYLVVQRSAISVESAVQEFEKAIELDPDYALAHAELAIAIVLQSRNNLGGLTYNQVFARAEPLALRALELDPNLAEAHAAIAAYLPTGPQALHHLNRAVEINPNYAYAQNLRGITLVSLGHYAEGFAAREAAFQLDPLFIPAVFNHGLGLIEQHRFAEAQVQTEKLAAISPGAHAVLRGYLVAARDTEWAGLALATLDALKIVKTRQNNTELEMPFSLIGLEAEALAVTETPLPEAMTRLGRPDLAVDAAQQQLADGTVSLIRRGQFGIALAGAGDYTQARPILEEMWRESGGRVDVIFGPESATALIAMRRAAGEDDSVDELLAAMLDNVRRYREAGIVTRLSFSHGANFEEGLAHYLGDERERGLELIAQGVEEGVLIPENQAYLQELYEDPGFAPILANQRERRSREREKFLSIVCDDNPYAEVWQPEEGTCEEFAARVSNLTR